MVSIIFCNAIFFNVMIAVGGDVFDEAKDSWTKGDLFEKNHVILMMERILFWRRNKN